MVDALSSSTLAASSAAQPLAKSEQGTALASDFETFLKMLTAQARYQDPMDPLDSAEYASQLAQFSSVEQSVRTNELLEQVAGQLGSHDLTSLASWIGKDVRNAAPVGFSGEPLSLTFDTVDGATNADLVAYDHNGVEVQRMEIDPETEAATWVGVSDAGKVFPSGQYSFHVEHYSGQTKLSAVPIYNYARITELSVDGEQPLLKLENGATITLDDILAVRPGSEADR